MKAAILAAGVGRRLAPLTHDRPKAMLNVGGRELIDFQLQMLTGAGFSLNDIVVVAGHKVDLLREALPSEVSVMYNPDFDTKNNVYTFYLLKDLEDDFVLLNCDTFCPIALVRDFVTACKERSLLSIDTAKPLADEEMKVYQSNGILTQISKTLDPEASYGEYIGLAYFTQKDMAHIVRQIETQLADGDDQCWYEDAIGRVLDKVDVHLHPFGNIPWIEIDDHADLDRAQTIAESVLNWSPGS